MSFDSEVAKFLEQALKDEFFGWAPARNPGMMKAELETHKDFVKQMPIYRVDKPRVSLYETVRKFLGKDTPNYPQQVGDCISFGHKNACEYIQAIELALGGGSPSDWHAIFPPWIYGASRVWIGNGRIRGDGSVGLWAQKALNQFGALFSDVQGVPQYSGSLARSWGRSGPPDSFKAEAVKHLTALQTDAAKISNWDQAKSAIDSGYGITKCDSYGFAMQPDRQGFWRRQGKWGHCTFVFLVDDGEPGKFDPHVGVLNSWGDNAMGDTPIDFRTGEPWPKGSFRIHRDDFEACLDEDDSWAIGKLGLNFAQRDLSVNDFAIV